VKTDTTVAGVDYNSSVVWVFDKFTISEFAVKQYLKIQSYSLEKGYILLMTIPVSYVKGASTFNHKQTYYVIFHKYSITMAVSINISKQHSVTKVDVTDI
jgi:hypothetical protein